MSVINTMLRDLDRRHASAILPTGTSSPPIESRRDWPRPALALCALAVIVGWGWEYRHTAKLSVTVPKTLTPPAPLIRGELSAAESVGNAPNSPSPDKGRAGEGFAAASSSGANSKTPKTLTPPAPLIRGELSAAESVGNAPNSPSPDKERAGEGFAAASSSGTNSKTPKTLTPPAPLIRGELSTAESVSNAPNSPSPDKGRAGEGFAPAIIKHTHDDSPDLAAARYIAARTALAQGRAQQAYDLLRDSPPALADATDYHAVLAAAEQQLGHYADAAARYRQLLQLDDRQAGWWLGLALSLDGAGNRADAKTSFERALSLDTLPAAARDYAASRVQILEIHSGR